MIIVEQLIFNVIALMLFVRIFFKIIQRNDTSYVIMLLIEAIGIITKFMELVLGTEYNITINIITYILAIILPIIVIAMERKKILFTETLYIMLARINMIIGNNKQAKKMLTKLNEKYPESYHGHKLLGKIYEQEGGMRKAIDEYAQSIEIKKNDYETYYKVAGLLHELDKKEESAEMLRTLLRNKPEEAQASQLLGEILIEQGNYKEAIYVLNDALKHNPTNYDLNYNLGIAYTMINDFQNAKLYYEKSATLNALEYNSRYSLAEIALMYKELDEAEKYLFEAMQDEELEADAYLELAKISLIKGEKDKAINYANLAIESDPVKIVEKIKNNNIFVIIYNKLSIPLNLENIEAKESKLSKKERMAKEHLEYTFEQTRNLCYNDIRMQKNAEKEKNEDKLNKRKEREQ